MFNKALGCFTVAQLLIACLALHKAEAQPDHTNSIERPRVQSQTAELPFHFIRKDGLSEVVRENNRRGIQLLSNLVRDEVGRDNVVCAAGITATNLLLLSGLSGSLERRLASILGLSNCSEEQMRQQTEQFLHGLNCEQPKSRFTHAVIVGSGVKLTPEYGQFVRKLGGLVALSSSSSDLRKIETEILQTSNRSEIKPPPSDSISFIFSEYFNGTWFSKFLIDETREDDFRTGSGSVRKVQMMQKWFQFKIPFLKGDNFQAVRLPFESQNNTARITTHGLYLILPDKETKFKEFVQHLAEHGLEDYASKWELRSGTLSMPRFKVGNQLSIPLPEDSQGSLNFADADLQQLCLGQQNIRSINIKQNVDFEVNENGTKASAVTECMMTLGGDRNVFHLKADRPFVFLLVDDRTGAVIFAGDIVNPEDSKVPFEVAENQWQNALEQAKQQNANFASGNGKIENIWYLLALQRIADFYRKEKRPEKAEQRLIEASKICQDTELQARTLDQLAQLYVSLNRYQEAEHLYQKLLPIQKRESFSHGPMLAESRTASYMTYLDHYITLLELMGRSPDEPRQEQELIYTKELERTTSLFTGSGRQGDRYPYQHVARTELLLAQFYARSKRVAKAEAFFQQSLKTAEKASPLITIYFIKSEANILLCLVVSLSKSSSKHFKTR